LTFIKPKAIKAIELFVLSVGELRHVFIKEGLHAFFLRGGDKPGAPKVQWGLGMIL
jgi:hypothetical protein